MQICLNPRNARIFSKIKFSKISCSNIHCLALTEVGNIYSWGYNIGGVLGVENNSDRLDQNVAEPERAEMLKEGIFVDIKAFTVCSFAIGIRGSPYVWGKPYRNMRNTDVLAAPVLLQMSDFSQEFMQENPFRSERKFEKFIKKKTQKYKTLESEKLNQPVIKHYNDTRTIFSKIDGKDYNYLLLDIRGRVFSFGSK